MNKNTVTLLLITVALALDHGNALAQGTQEQDDVDLTIDAQLGFESLQEPKIGESGLDVLDTSGYITVNAAALLQLYNLQAFMQGPLRFTTEDFSIREQDWDETSEFLRIFRCARVDYMSTGGSGIRYTEGGSCASWTPDEAVGSVSVPSQPFTYLSLRLHPLTNYSLGYGSIVNGFNAVLEEDHFIEGVTTEVNLNRSLVFSAALSDIADLGVTAGRLAYRPIQRTSQEEESYYGYYGYPQQATENELFVEVGVTTAADIAPPISVQAGTGTVIQQGDPLVIGGVDARLRYSSESTATMESYRVLRFELGTEYNQIFDFAGAFHNHLRFYYDVGEVDFFVDAEYRAILGQYIPSYFDQHYRIQRSQFLLSDSQRQALGMTALSATKRDFLDALSDDTEHAYGATARFRFWKDQGTGGGWDRAADVWLFLEQIPRRDLSGRAGIGTAIYRLDNKVDVWAQFVQQGWDDFSGLFSLANSILEVDARYLLTEEIYVNFFYDQTWFLMNAEQFDTTHDLGFSLGFLSGI